MEDVECAVNGYFLLEARWREVNHEGEAPAIGFV
jgi:hypothetical protein